MDKAILSDKLIGIDIVVNLYRDMYRSRCIDELELEYVNRGEAFFHVSGAGHESMVALNPHLKDADYLHCHYRDKSLMLARGITTEMFFMGLFCKDGSHSRGRQMSAHLSAREFNILSLVGPVGNNALQAVGVAMAIKHKAEKPIVLCAAGDGSTQEGEYLEAIAEAVRHKLPVLFVIEDNGLAISTFTEKQTFYDHPDCKSTEFCGIPIVELDGCNLLDSYSTFDKLVGTMRMDRKPRIVLMKVQRLSNHTNADDQRIYRSEGEISSANKKFDPVNTTRRHLILNDIEEHFLQKIETEIKKDVCITAETVFRNPDPQCCYTAHRDLVKELRPGITEYSGDGENYDLTMLEAIRDVLGSHLRNNRLVSLYGQDIEDPKGDVFGLTKGLSTAYPDRVRNSPLCEATIVGTAIGRALAGEMPVAFLQFADFLPIAFNQIISEMGSMHWRTDGSWQCPMIIMAACGAFRPGLGTFHAQTMESIAAHVPGIDVMMPATAGDAAALLNAAFKSGRPTIFFYPKACLNEKAYATSNDLNKHIAAIGSGRKIQTGDDITFVAYGNTVSICQEAINTLEKSGIGSELIDLRFIAPWDKEMVIKSAKRTGHLIVVHEDNHSCGMGAEVIATVSEALDHSVKVARVTRPDTYIPCNFTNQLEILPSYKRIVESACKLLNLELEWEFPEVIDDGFNYINAIGTSPSDSTVRIIEWYVNVGDQIKKGELLASYEANKASAELLSPCDGEITEILLEEENDCDVGTPILKLISDQYSQPVEQHKFNGKALIHRCVDTKPKLAIPEGARRQHDLAIAGIGTKLGSKKVSNDELLKAFPGKIADDVVRATGIESRFYADDDESVLSLAVVAAASLLNEQGLTAADIDMVIVSTGTPDLITPSLACRLLSELAGEDEDVNAQAHDINAACSAYLYALQSAYDYLQGTPSGRVLIVSTEILSRLVDAENYDSAFIFGDAATATLINGHNHLDRSKKQLYVKRPLLGSSPECGEVLAVPLLNSKETIRMNGKKLFTEAVRKMIMILGKAAKNENINLDEISLIVPHQANKRIIQAIQSRLNFTDEKVFCNIEQLGNTSSNTIPLALNDIFPDLENYDHLGLCSFGGGFTYGATILEYK